MQGTPIIYFKSLNRPFHVLGVERSLFFLIVSLCVPIVFSGRLSLKVDILALILFVILHTVCLLITRADAQMLGIYRRHIHYKKYYPAQSGIHAAVPLIKPSVPIYQGMRGLV